MGRWRLRENENQFNGLNAVVCSCKLGRQQDVRVSRMNN